MTHGHRQSAVGLAIARTRLRVERSHPDQNLPRIQARGGAGLELLLADGVNRQLPLPLNIWNWTPTPRASNERRVAVALNVPVKPNSCNEGLRIGLISVLALDQQSGIGIARG